MKYVLYERQYYTANQKPQVEADITAFAKANNAEAVGIMPIRAPIPSTFFSRFPKTKQPGITFR